MDTGQFAADVEMSAAEVAQIVGRIKQYTERHAGSSERSTMRCCQGVLRGGR
jgi:hypothetical protein